MNKIDIIKKFNNLQIYLLDALLRKDLEILETYSIEDINAMLKFLDRINLVKVKYPVYNYNYILEGYEVLKK